MQKVKNQAIRSHRSFTKCGQSDGWRNSAAVGSKLTLLVVIVIKSQIFTKTGRMRQFDMSFLIWCRCSWLTIWLYSVYLRPGRHNSQKKQICTRLFIKPFQIFICTIGFSGSYVVFRKSSGFSKQSVKWTPLFQRVHAQHWLEEYAAYLHQGWNNS